MKDMTPIPIPGTKEYMLSPYFWINKIEKADSIILTSDEINEFNNTTIKKVNTLCRMCEYKDRLSKEELISLIESYKIPEKTRYDVFGQNLKEDFYKGLIKNTNIEGIKDLNEVKFGLTIKNTRIRSFPTDMGSYGEADDIEFDLFQETECLAIEPVAILHESYDGEWFFIQMYNYNGWVKYSDVAVGRNKKEIFDYIECDKFLIVTGNRVQTQFNHYDSRVSKKDFFMGTKIPLEIEYTNEVGKQAVGFNHVIKLPVRDLNGRLEFKDAILSNMEDVNIGYLPYTRKNILAQAFKLQGDRYDWGNKNNGRDCSSFVMYVYKTCGIILPRNADDQEISHGISYKFQENQTIAERSSIFGKVAPGALIFMNGHVMIYIGEVNNEYFMIHDFHRYGIYDKEVVQLVEVNEVAVTSTLILTSKGKKFIETFTSLLQLS